MTSSVNCLLLVSLLVSACTHTTEKVTVNIPEGKVGIVGYGSLTSKDQLEYYFDEEYTGPFQFIHLEGYVRRWSGRFPNDSIHPPEGVIVHCMIDGDTLAPQNIIVLNIHQEPGSAINGSFFILDQNQLKLMDQAEIGYERFEVTDQIREFRVEGGPVYAYRARSDYQVDEAVQDLKHTALPSVYLDFIDEAASGAGEIYKKEFYESTAKVDKSLVLNCYITE